MSRLPVTTYPLRLALPLAAFMLLFFAAPLAMLAFVSFYGDPQMSQWGALAKWQKMFDAFGLGVLADTLWLGVQVTLLCARAGLRAGLDLCAHARALQTLVIFIVMLPLLTSVVVRTFAWIVILGRQGIVNSALMEIGLIEGPLKLLYTRRDS